MQELERSREIKYRAVTEAVRFVLSPGMSLRLGELGTFQWSPQCDGEEQKVEHKQEESVEVKLVEEQKGAAAPAAGAAAPAAGGAAAGGGVQRFVMVGGPAAPLPSLPSVAMDSTTIKRDGGGVIDMKVDNSDPSKSVVRIPPGSGRGSRTIFSGAPLPRGAVTCWNIRICSSDNPRDLGLGVHSDPPASCGNPAKDAAAVVWWGTGDKYTHTTRTREPGLGKFRVGDVFHLKYDHKASQLHLRVDSTPNRHFTATLRPAPHYYACLSMYDPGVCEVQAEAAGW